MRITGLDHLALSVGDLDKAEDFYSRILDAELVRRIGATPADREMKRMPQSIMRAGDIVFNLNAGEPDIPDGHFIHWAFKAEFEDLDAWIETFKKEGIKYYGPFGHGGAGRISLYFHDHVGYLFELGMGVADWETAKAEVIKRGGAFGSTEATYDPGEWERINKKYNG